MDGSPVPEEPRMAGLRVLGQAGGTSSEDPFGPGDPLEVARLVRRALAAAGRRADTVAALVVVTDRTPPEAALVRFTRRSLGPHGAMVRAATHAVAPDLHHGDRVAAAMTLAVSGRPVTILVVLGPGEQATALCLG